VVTTNSSRPQPALEKDRLPEVKSRVLVDATAVPADRGGVGRYVDELLPALIAEGGEIAVVCQQRDAAFYGGLVGAQRVSTAPAWAASVPGRLIWEQLRLPAAARAATAAVLHCPHYTMPLATRVPVVTTLHDATFFTDPEVHLPVKRRFFRAWTRVSLRRARRAVTPSAATRDELVRVAGARRERVDVAHLGVDGTRFHPPTDAEVARVRAALDLGDTPYVAFLGTLEPRKNVPALVRAWVRASAGRDVPPALVLAGGRGWDEEIDRVAAEVPAGLRLLRTGYLPLEDLAGLLGGAELVAYPSLGEGFGLPVLEAMACGAPVLTTRRLALPEVGGDAVAYCEPDVAGIEAGLRSLLDDPARRAELAAVAAARAAGFTWAATARAHLASYARAAR
jgi:glycosyltransferase involved in cell wall biosynthesis